MNKIFKWILLSNRGKFKSISTHFYKFIHSLIYFIDPKIINNVSFNHNSNKYKYTENKNGKYLVFNNDGGISRQLYVNGEYNLKTLKKTVNILGKFTLILDVGANIGSTCISSIKRNYSKTAIAIEADEKNYKLLKTNVAINNLEKKISTFNYLVTDKNKNFKQIKKKNNFGANYFIETNNPILNLNKKKISLNKFTKYLKKNKTLVWIDTQGHEPYVLNGSSKLIKSNIPFVIEFTPKFFKRLKNENVLIKNLKKFKFYYDLCNQTKKTKINIDNIKFLFEKYKNGNTELLLVNF